MRSEIILFITFFVLPFNSFSQVNSESDFNKFKSFFYKDKINNVLIKIPLDLCRKILSEKIIGKDVVSVNAYKIFEKKECITVIIELIYPQEGYASSHNIFSFAANGKLKKSASIGSTGLDAEGGTSCELHMINDSLLEAKEKELKYNSNREEIVYRIDYSYFVINGQGFYNVVLPRPAKGRLYPQYSLRILDLYELKKVDKEDREIIRNEIIADHGYIFKTEKWIEYFKSKNWYNPRYDDVTDKLTVIEKINIENILNSLR